MSKAARIRDLIAQGKTNKEIAAAVGCLEAYVRHQRQILAGKRPQIEHIKRCRAARDHMRPYAVAKARQAYRQARDNGKSVKEAGIIRVRVFNNAMLGFEKNRIPA